jgi:hypothetical protein
MTMTPEQIETASKTMDIFFPYASRKRRRMIENNGRFVHYTTAENALNIIKSKRIWMRNATCMTDYREVHHGFEALNRYFKLATTKDEFNTAVNECSQGAAEEAVGLFNQWWQSTQVHTYITSISEHEKSEDLHGRLSMWRAFGGGATPRVALVVKIPLEFASNQPLNAILNPVGYFTDEDVAREFNSVAENVRSNRDFISKLGHQILVSNVFSLLVMGTICLKHEGFVEEKEWRIVYSPKRMPSPIMETSIEVVAGIPQQVYKIPLENNPSAGITGLAIPDLLDHVIVGPTQFPWVMYEAFVAALDTAGVKDAGSRVAVSQIPVRT